MLTSIPVCAVTTTSRRHIQGVRLEKVARLVRGDSISTRDSDGMKVIAQVDTWLRTIVLEECGTSVNFSDVLSTWTEGKIHFH